MTDQCIDGFCAITTKAQRVVTPLTPAEEHEQEMAQVRATLAQYKRDIFTPVEETPPTPPNQPHEQSQDSKSDDQRSNPQAQGKLKPTRKGSPQETTN